METQAPLRVQTCPECDRAVDGAGDLPTTYEVNPHRKVDAWRLLPCGHTLRQVRVILMFGDGSWADPRPTLEV